jgi:hypothetical protein
MESNQYPYNRINPNDPRRMSNNPHQQRLPPQYPNYSNPQNNLTTPFILNQSLPSTSFNNENPYCPPDYNNEQYILDMDSLYQGYENSIQPLNIQRNQPQDLNINMTNQSKPLEEPQKDQNIKKEDQNMIKEKKEELTQNPNQIKPDQYIPINQPTPAPRPPVRNPPNRNYAPLPNNYHQNNQNNLPRRGRNSRPDRVQKSINNSVRTHCKMYGLNKKKPLYFSCHRCKQKTKSIVKQE